MISSRLIGPLFLLFFALACSEDTDGGIDGADASGDSSQTGRDGAADSSAREDARVNLEDGMVQTPDAAKPDAMSADASDSDATVPDAALGDASTVIPDAAAQCTNPDQCSVPSDSCSEATLTDYEPTCSEGKCGVQMRQGACADGTDTCRDLNHVTYEPQCADGSSCGAPKESVEACTAPTDVCKGGTLTAYTATCDPRSGCGTTSRESTCPANDSTCLRLVHYSYSPSCADSTSCSSTGAATKKSCTASAATCAKGQLTSYAATCDDVKGCGETSRTTMCPTKASFCDRLTHHSYLPNCTRDGSACSDPIENTTPCTAPSPVCKGGVRRNYSATCDAEQGCSTTASDVTCPDLATTCETTRSGPLLTTYTPTCLDGSQCNREPTATQTICTAPPNKCDASVWYTYSPVCDVKLEKCLVKGNKTDCGAASRCAIEDFGEACVVSYTEGLCDPAKGCYQSDVKEVQCKPGQCQCSPTPGCAA